MKRNFLLTLLMTLLPLAGWASDVLKVSGYDVTIDNKLVVLSGESVAAPQLQSITKTEGGTTKQFTYELGDIYGTDGKTVTALKKVGSYFQQVIVTVNETANEIETASILVPFMVVKTGSNYFTTEYIWNSATWNESRDNGLLKYYFLQFPWYDLYRAEPFFAGNLTESDWNELADGEKAAYSHDWKAIAFSQQAKRNLMFPQINFAVKGLQREGDDQSTWEKYAVYATYKERVLTDDPTATEPVYVTKGTYTALGDDGKPELFVRGQYWMLSIPELYKGYYPLPSGGDRTDGLTVGQGYVLNYNQGTGETVDPEGHPLTYDGDNPAGINDALGPDFAWEYVNLYLAPQEAPFTLTATLSDASLVYNRSKQAPVISTVTYNNEVITSGYEVTWYDGGEVVDVNADNSFINAGKYIGVVTYKDAVAIVEYNITRVLDKVILDPAYAEKVYGQKDPVPNYVVFKNEDNVTLSTEILPYLKLARSDEDPEATREDVGDHKYFIDFTEDYRAGKCNYEITIRQNHSLLTITPAPLTVTVSPASKQYKGAEPTAFTYTLTNPAQLKNNDEYKEGKPGTDDIIQAITRKPGDNVGESYDFVFTSKNYNVTATNKFTIEPAGATGLQFAFEPATYTYNGQPQKPTKVTITDPAVTVNGAAYKLESGVDFEEITDASYTNNTNAGQATLSVTLKGNYSGTATGNFTIGKKTLYIQPNSYTSEQTTYGWTYDGFVDGESADGANSTIVAAGFTVPTTTVVTKGGEVDTDVFKLVANKTGFSATNYDFDDTRYGLLALNGTQGVLTVVADEYKKEYDGKNVDPTKLTVTVTGGNADLLKLSNGDYVYEIAAAATGKNGNANATQPNVGKYDITLRGATVINGYTVNYQGRTAGCEIDYRPIALQVADARKVYKDAMPTLTASVVPADKDGKGGLIGSDTEAEIGLVNNGANNTGYNVTVNGWSYAWWANPAYWYNDNEHVTAYELNTDGTVKTETDTRYTITTQWRSNSSTGIFGNYKVTETKVGKLTVDPARVTIAAKAAEKQYGQADPSFEVTITPTPVTGDQLATPQAVANQVPEAYYTVTRTDKTADDGEDVKAHTTLKAVKTAAYDAQNPQNWVITFDETLAALTITPAQIYVKANGQWINFGGNINTDDVEIIIPQGEGTKTLKIQKAKVVDGVATELTPDQIADNTLLKSIGDLVIAKDENGKDKNKVGTNYDAFEYRVTPNGNYVLATGEKKIGEYTYVNGFCNNTLLVYPLAEIPLDKDMLAEAVPNKTLQEVLDAHQGSTVTVILPGRAMKANDWYSWVLPFDVTPRDFFYPVCGVVQEEITNLPEQVLPAVPAPAPRLTRWGYGVIETLDESKTTAKSVCFKIQAVGTIEANTPFIVKVDEDITANEMKEIRFPNVTIGEWDYLTDNPFSGTEGTVQFTGVYYDTEKGDLDASALTLRRYKKGATAEEMAKEPLEWWPAAANVTVKRTAAYLQFPTAAAAAGAKIYIQEEDGTYTAINGVEADGTIEGEGIYNLSGQRVNKAQKGIYIVNGKKVLVK